MSLEKRAKNFAQQAHGRIDQRRKYTDEPYIVHPAEVVQIVKTVQHDETMVAAAWLHDVVEDTPVSHDTIKNEFGEQVAELVFWLTDHSTLADGNRAVRKAIDRERLAKAPVAAQTVKVADLISNSGSILEYDAKFAQVYLKEKALLLNVLNKADKALVARAWAIVETAELD